MRNNYNVITSKQLIFTIIGAVIGVGILTLTSTIAREARQDSWISTLVGSLVPVVSLFCIHLIGRKFPDYTFAEYCEIVLGKWAGKFLALVFVVYTLIFASLVTRIFVNVLKMYLFPVTPVWALGALILVISGYLACQDARVIARVNELMFFESLVLLGFALGATPNIDLTFFLPVGETGINGILMGAYQTIFAFLGIEILLVIYPMVQNKQEIIKAGLTAISIITSIYLFLAIVILGIFGPDVLPGIRFGLLILLKTYHAPVIERGEFFFLIFWVFVAFRPIANMYFASRYTTEKVLGIDNPILVTVILFPAALAISLVPRNYEQALSYSTTLGLVGMVFMFVVPILLWLVSSLRGVGGKKHA